MSSRLSCWLSGHDWGRVQPDRYSDIVGNLWRLQWCRQCSARRRALYRRWSERTYEAGE